MTPRRWLLASLALALVAADAAGVEITGKVTNGTTGHPVADQTVSLLALRGQMVPLGEAVTNADGGFRFIIEANPNERFLVQAPFRGVNYNRPALGGEGGRIRVDLEVFETGARPEDVTLRGHVIFLEPAAARLRVSEFYSVRNRSQPPRTYAPDEGSFRFRLPAGAADLQVSAGRPGGMPLRQQPQPAAAKDSYVIPYAIYPGDAEIQVTYAVPLVGDALELRLPLAGRADQRHVAIPSVGIELQGDGLEELAQSQVPQARVFNVEGSARKELALRLRIDPAVLESAGETGGGAGAGGAGGSPVGAENAVSIVPHPVNRAQWYIVGLSLVVLLMGLYYLDSLVAPHAAAKLDRRH